MEEETKFPLEKVLTCSAEDYCQSKGKKLEEYDLVGVHYLGYDYNKDIFEYFIEKIPGNAEVLSDLQYTISLHRRASEGGIYACILGHVSGTALMPKSKEDSK